MTQDTTQPAAPAEPAKPPAPAQEAPIPEAVLDDWRWVNQERGTGRFDEHAGKHVAVLGREVLGSSWDPILLRQYLAEKHGLDPERLVIFYVDPR